MTTVDRIKEALARKHIAISRMEKDLGFSNGYIAQLRKGTLPADRLDAIAKYLGEDPMYLLYGEEYLAQYGGEADDELLEFEEELEIMKEEPATRSLLRSSKGLTAEQVKAVSEIIKQMRRGTIDDT